MRFAGVMCQARIVKSPFRAKINAPEVKDMIEKNPVRKVGTNYLALLIPLVLILGASATFAYQGRLAA